MTFEINTPEDTIRYKKLMCELLNYSCSNVLNCTNCSFHTEREESCARHEIAKLLQYSRKLIRDNSVEDFNIILYTMKELSRDGCYGYDRYCKNCILKLPNNDCARIKIRNILYECDYHDISN